MADVDYVSPVLTSQIKYSQMREAIDKTLQQLYWACRRKEDFPGRPPDLEKSTVTTNDILEALGLIGSEMNGLNPEESSNMAKRTLTSPTGVDSLHTQLTETTVPLPSPNDPERGKTSPILLPRLAMKGQQPHMSSDATLPQLDPLPCTTLEGRIETVSKDELSRRASETYLELNSQLHVPTSTFEPTRGPSQSTIFLSAHPSHNTTSWIAPVNHIELDPSGHNLGTSTVDRVRFNAQPTLVSISSEPGIEMHNSPRCPPTIIGDGFLPPWAGSLEPAYQASQIGRQN
ncbi:uncharacterized protein Z518_06547 [Rhinocladiella mackenziei CBS 650.93]|uniref:Uncharacterized protein n=1 Tax=Rhinocladiella mackenziei CBS 650.93 TaxID=1442369 RepID=A0A0D2FLZ9_9EURO|nr:uncharacterized protein Z518_06547 [Rhinocladiella mackenziei CBS 650.93]KIX02997.1 hypothetical protein Z518_06547 [Rhinocladiella mackenziei CBS 650.93]